MSSGKSHRDEGIYYVVVDGVPQHCQWQELKDYLRDFAKVSPGYANVLKTNEDGTRVGYCPLRNKLDANRAFEYLVAEGWQGLDIRVSLIWKTDLHSDKIERKRGPEASRRKRPTVPRVQMPIRPRQPPCSGAVNSAYPPVTIPDQRQVLYGIQGPCGYRTSTMQRRDAAYTTMDVPDVQVWPLISAKSLASQDWSQNSTVASPSQSSPDLTDIYLAQLPSGTTTQTLKQMLSSFGNVTEVYLRRGKGKSEKQSFATARYDDSAGAMHAIQSLNGRKVGAHVLEVRYSRFDAATTPNTKTLKSISPGPESKGCLAKTGSAEMSSSVGPLVVNGARGYGHGPRHPEDDDSGSDEEYM